MTTVSVGLPVYNGERYLAATLGSLLGQTFGDLEVIVSDNASTDGTEEIARSWAAKDARVRYLRHPANIGANRNYNRTVDLAQGRYFRWSGHDDLCRPAYLEKCVPVLDRDEGAVLCHSRTRIIDGEGEALSPDPASGLLVDRTGRVRIEKPDPLYATSSDPVERFHEALRQAVTCHHALGLIRTSALRRTGRLGPYYSADRALLAELALHGRFREVPEELFLKREHPNNSRSLSAAEKADWAGSWLPALGPSFKGLEYLQITKAVLRSPLSRRDKLRCLLGGAAKAVVGRARKLPGAAAQDAFATAERGRR